MEEKLIEKIEKLVEECIKYRKKGLDDFFTSYEAIDCIKELLEKYKILKY